MRRAIIAASIFVAQVASADPHKLLVLKSDGTADDATKAKVDAEVLRLARTISGVTVEAGEITFGDAAAAVGCSGSEAQCRDDVMGTMGVDEIVSINVAAAPGGELHVTLHRIPKAGAIKDGASTVPAGQPLEAKLDADVGPVFGVKATPVAPQPAFGNVPTPPAPVPAPTPSPTPPPAPVTAQPAFGDAGGPRTAQVDTSLTPTPTNDNGTPITQPAEGRVNGPVIGMSVGGGLVVLSLIMWGEASATQGDINNAPTKTTTDFKNLQDLESKGDTYAGLGNVFFIGGIVTAGVSGYFFWRRHRAHSTSSTAFVTPTLFDHGAGLALTIGGSP